MDKEIKTPQQQNPTLKESEFKTNLNYHKGEWCKIINRFCQEDCDKCEIYRTTFNKR
jgi:hypothetical protein